MASVLEEKEGLLCSNVIVAVASIHAMGSSPRLGSVPMLMTLERRAHHCHLHSHARKCSGRSRFPRPTYGGARALPMRRRYWESAGLPRRSRSGRMSRRNLADAVGHGAGGRPRRAHAHTVGANTRTPETVSVLRAHDAAVGRVVRQAAHGGGGDRLPSTRALGLSATKAVVGVEVHGQQREVLPLVAGTDACLVVTNSELLEAINHAPVGVPSMVRIDLACASRSGVSHTVLAIVEAVPGGGEEPVFGRVVRVDAEASGIRRVVLQPVERVDHSAVDGVRLVKRESVGPRDVGGEPCRVDRHNEAPIQNVGGEGGKGDICGGDESVLRQIAPRHDVVVRSVPGRIEVARAVIRNALRGGHRPSVAIDAGGIVLGEPRPGACDGLWVGLKVGRRAVVAARPAVHVGVVPE
eukprot:scaffold104276_cov75-Phaeocystis_antarctica.AAC.4